MAEWLILLLVVPAIVVPAMLLLGFAGCNPVFGLDPVTLTHPPVIGSAIGTSTSTITLTWTFDGPPPDDFEFERTRLPDPSKPPPLPSDPEYQPQNFLAVSSPHDDTGLVRATTYLYRGRRHYDSGSMAPWGDRVPGATLAGFAILPDITQNESFGNRNTDTVKCEIAVADLIVPPFMPTLMWITLGQRAAAGEDITFSKVFVGHQAAAGDAWDADSLTPVLFGGAASTVIAPGDISRSDEITFAWDPTSALIVSMYFAGGPASDLLEARTGTNSKTHLKAGADEAGRADSDPPYTLFSGYLSGVVKIEVE